MSELTIVTVNLADREDGGLRVYSDDLPGLILSGRDKVRVLSMIGAAIEAIFKHKGFQQVSVRQSRPIGEILRMDRPCDVDMHVQHEQFVVEVAKAA